MTHARLSADVVPFALLENAEADSWVEIQHSVPESFRERFGIHVARVAGAVVITGPRSDMPAVNRTWLPGHRPMATQHALDEILDHARSRGAARLLVHCPPWAGADALVLPHGRPVTPMVKLYRRADARIAHRSTLRVDCIGPADRELFGELAARGNEAPSFLSDGFNSTVGEPGWKHYLAYDGDTPIAVAAMRIHEHVAWCCFAGTLPEYRGRGGQRALLARRVRDAAAAGCTWVTTEALPDRPEGRSQSLANMLATGFSVAYERPSVVVELRAAGE